MRTIKTDEQAINWMNANNNATVNGILNQNVRYHTLKGAIGFQYLWKVGKTGLIGLAAGVESLSETITANNGDIGISFRAEYFGPTIRVSARW